MLTSIEFFRDNSVGTHSGLYPTSLKSVEDIDIISSSNLTSEFQITTSIAFPLYQNQLFIKICTNLNIASGDFLGMKNNI